jgi:hypothetical protein
MRSTFAAIIPTGVTWPGDEITVGFLPDFHKQTIYKKRIDVFDDDLEHQLIGLDNEKVVKHIIAMRLQPFMTTKLVFVDDVNSADIRIGSTWVRINEPIKNLGTLAKLVPKTEATMTVGVYSVGAVLKAFCYALGMEYEHRNPINNPIIWDHESAYEWLKDTGLSRSYINQEWFEPCNPVAIKGSSFDMNSIMLDVPSNIVKNAKGTFGTNYILSPLDVTWIAKIYAPTMTLQDIHATYLSIYRTNIRYIPVIEPMSISGGHTNTVMIGSVVGAVIVLGIWLYSKNKPMTSQKAA